MELPGNCAVSPEYLVRLVNAVALNSVSPMSSSQKEKVDEFLAEYQLRRVADDVWARPPVHGATWCYSHIDTKPPLPIEAWNNSPYTLQRIGSKLIGLGVSDAKFQLLNMLDVFANSQYGILVDGAEECGAIQASTYLNAAAPERLLIVDGAAAIEQDYGQTLGQYDGFLHYASSLEPIHPGREKRGQLLEWLADLQARTSQLHFNVTGLTCPETVRSLTLETLLLRFDLRFRIDQQAQADEFVRSLNAEIRQHYTPLAGSKDFESLTAGFSCPLGGLDCVQHLRVLPGGRPENGAHRPNEWIEISQVSRHRQRLMRFKNEEGWNMSGDAML